MKHLLYNVFSDHPDHTAAQDGADERTEIT